MHRFKHIFLYIILLAAAAVQASGQTRRETVRFEYDLDFEMNFDNREFYKSNFSESMTIFGARLTPSVGVDVRQGNSMNHRLMAGIDIMKDFGDSLAPKDLLREVTLYYNMEKTFRRCEFTMYAGIFPRKAMEGRWGEAFFSDSLTFYDNNLEGLLLKLRRQRAYFELGADWMGLTGEYRRERFILERTRQDPAIYTSGIFRIYVSLCRFEKGSRSRRQYPYKSISHSRSQQAARPSESVLHCRIDPGFAERQEEYRNIYLPGRRRT